MLYGAFEHINHEIGRYFFRLIQHAQLKSIQAAHKEQVTSGTIPTYSSLIDQVVSLMHQIMYVFTKSQRIMQVHDVLRNGQILYSII